MDKLKLLYKILKYRLILMKPKTFNEKIQYKALYDRREILTTFADRILMRKYVYDSIGPEFLPEAYHVNHEVNSIPWRDIPKEFVFKVNHGSGGIVLVSNEFSREATIPKNLKNEGWTTYKINPLSLVKEDLIILGNHWLTLNYYWYEGCGRIPEWAYKNIKRGILIEELLKTPGGGMPVDYKFHMFNGECQWINVINRNSDLKTNRKSITHSNIFNSKWEKIIVTANGNPPLSPPPRKPKNLSAMLAVAKKLTGHIDYLRVDLYSVSERIIVGELTNYPMAGMNTYDPPFFDIEMGDKLILDNYRGEKLKSMLDKIKRVRNHEGGF